MSVRRAASAGLWSTIDVALRQVVQFGVSLILARLLTPADFGTVALMTFFSTLASTLLQHGLATALVQRQNSSREEESTVFWFNLLVSAALAGLLVAVAPAVSRFYAIPALQGLLWAAAAQVLLSALAAVSTAILTRDLQFAALMKAGVVASVTSGVVGVGGALAGWGVWALAAQAITAALVNSAAMLWVCAWRPTLTCRFAAIRPIIGFGSWLSLSAILEVLYAQGFALLLGKLHGPRDLGFYNRASNTQQLPSSILSTIIGRVALPLFSARTDEPQAIVRGMRTAISVAMLLNAPAMVGLILFSDLVVRVLFGPQWASAATTLSILAAAGLLMPIHVINLNVLLAHGGSRTYFQLEIAKKVVGIACIVVGSIFGLVGLAWSQVIAGVISLALNAGPARRRLHYGIERQIADLGGIALASTVMALVTWEIARLIALPPILELALVTLVGALVYFAAGFGLRLRSFVEAWGIARLTLDRRQAVKSASKPA